MVLILQSDLAWLDDCNRKLKTELLQKLIYKIKQNQIKVIKENPAYTSSNCRIFAYTEKFLTKFYIRCSYNEVNFVVKNDTVNHVVM